MRFRLKGLGGAHFIFIFVLCVCQELLHCSSCFLHSLFPFLCFELVQSLPGIGSCEW